MQEMIDQLTARGYEHDEAVGLITYFRDKGISDGSSVEEFIDRLVSVLDQYKELNGEYVNLVIS